jgi:serine/threonine protein kinase
MIGTTLSHYKIISKLGQGGQGEVYLAEDSRLDRKVALKILPEHLSERADSRERFEREARAVSSLNHPHICTLHDIGEQDGIHFLVMEHLEGESLADRLEKGALSLEQTLEYAIQIADALDKAHRQGVVHRDLKPGNIMLVKSGAKLLDFGLAKLKATEATEENLSNLPTEQANLTQEGTILGTLQYMAPEQLEGKDADSRTDIFAFGAVVYEMATGKKAFEGSSQASLIAAILKDDPPPMSELQPMTPSVLDQVVKQCLEKEPDERWQTASDLMKGLKWVNEVGARKDSIPTVTAPGVWRRVIPFGVGVLALVIVGVFSWVGVFSSRTTDPESSPLIQFVINPPETASMSGRRFSDLVISPDGRQVVYHGTRQQLFIRPLEKLTTKAIPGTEGADRDFFFSPDGEWVAFAVSSQLKKVALRGGAPITLCPAPTLEGGSWSPEGMIVFASGDGLFRVSADGGESTNIATANPDKGESEYQHPHILPGGEAVLFTIYRGGSDYQTAVLSLGTGVQKVIRDNARNPRFVSPGHLVYEIPGTGTLMAIPFDRDELEVTGDALPVLEGVSGAVGQGSSDYDISEDGTLVYVSGAITGFYGSREQSLVWVDREGQEFQITARRDDYARPRISPDGKQVALAITGDDGLLNIWIYDLEKDSFNRITFEGLNSGPEWSPDGKWVSFRSDRDGHHSHYRKLSDGSGSPVLIVAHERRVLGGVWSPDGNAFLFDSLPVPGSPPSIFVVLTGGQSTPQRFLSSLESGHSPAISPDGKWVVYVSTESGRDEVYVRSYGGGGGKWRVSAEGGTEPRWSPDMKELFFRNGVQMMTVAVEGKPTFSADSPQLLFEGRYGTSPLSSAEYDYSLEHERFLMIKESEEGITQINVVLNWFEELKRLVPSN